MNARVMGIVNVTPDSFSDGGRYYSPEEAIRRARKLIAEGARIIDLGGESTRPGATPIGWQEEWARIEPVLEGLLDTGVPLSVDTYHPETAARAVAAGAGIINCVYAEPVPAMLAILRAHPDVELVAVPSAVSDGKVWATFGDRIYLDPMIGFGTTRDEDIARIRSVPELARRGRVLVGASRKRIVRKLTGEKTLGKMSAGSVAVALWSVLHGASVVRVHDVAETVQALKVVAALEG